MMNSDRASTNTSRTLDQEGHLVRYIFVFNNRVS